MIKSRSRQGGGPTSYRLKLQLGGIDLPAPIPHLHLERPVVFYQALE